MALPLVAVPRRGRPIDSRSQPDRPAVTGASLHDLEPADRHRWVSVRDASKKPVPVDLEVVVGPPQRVDADRQGNSTARVRQPQRRDRRCWPYVDVE